MSPKMTRTTTADRVRMRTWKAYGEALKRLEAALPLPIVTHLDAADIAARVIEACRGMGWGAWIELDERSGHRDLAGRFHYVRQTRNGEHGRDLIAAVNKRVPGRTYA